MLGLLRANHFVNSHEQGVRTKGRAGRATVEQLAPGSARTGGGHEVAALVVRSRFSRGCEKRWARTESLRNLHIHSKEFAKDHESAICTDFGNHRPLVYTPFACFGRSRPPDTPALKAATCTTPAVCEGNLPASMAMRAFT